VCAAAQAKADKMLTYYLFMALISAVLVLWLIAAFKDSGE